MHSLLAHNAGRLPFEGKDKPEIKRNITSNNLAPLPSFLTPQCQSFIKAMLTWGVDERPSCAQLLQHPYIAMYCAPPPAPKPATLPNVIALNAYSPGAGMRVLGGFGMLGCRFQSAGPSLSLLHPEELSQNACPVAAPAHAGGGPQEGRAGSNGTWRCQQPKTSPRQGASLPSSCSYRDALTGGRAPAPPHDDTRSPRTPGGSHIPVTVSRNAAATSAQHSPTILAQSGYTVRPDPFASPMAPRDGATGAGGVSRKISFDFFSPAAAAGAEAPNPKPSPLAGDSKVCGEDVVRAGAFLARWLVPCCGHKQQSATCMLSCARDAVAFLTPCWSHAGDPC